MTPSEVFGGLPAAWLLTYAIHSTVLLGAAWAVARFARPSLPLREALWKAALLGALVTASWQVAVPGAIPPGGRLRLPQRDAAVVAAPPSYRLVPGGFVVQTADEAFPSPVSRGSVSPTAERSAPRAWWRALSPFLPGVLVAFWILGAALSLFRLGSAKVRLHRLLRDRRPVTSGPLLELLHRLRRSSGLRRPVRLTVSSRIPGPVALGRAEICLPARALTDLDRAHQESVLAHELGHLARRDPAWLVAAATVEAVFFFQPLNRLARRALRETAEFRCDDWAVAHTGRGLILARCLAEVAGWIQGPARPSVASAMAEGGSPLVRRIERLLDDRPRRADRLRAWAWIAVGAMVAATAAIAPGVTAGRRAPAFIPAEVSVVPAVSVSPDPAPAGTPRTPTPRIIFIPGASATESPAPGALPPLRDRVRLVAPALPQAAPPSPEASGPAAAAPAVPPEPGVAWEFHLGDDVRIDLAPLVAALAETPEARARLEAFQDRFRTQFGPDFERFLREELGPQLEQLNRELDPATRAQILSLRNQVIRERVQRRLEEQQKLREDARAAREALRAAQKAALRARTSGSAI